MHPMGDARDHFWLTIGMSKAVGIDLAAALKSGEMPQADYAQMVTRCRRCDNPTGCRALLDQHPELEMAPEYCTNQAFLADLAQRER